MPAKKNLLLVFYGGGHVNAITPLFPYLKEEYNLHILALSTAKNKILELGYNPIDITKYTNKSNIDYVYNIAKQQHNAHIGIEFEDTLSYYSIGFDSLVKKFSISEAYKVLNSEGRKAFYPVDFFCEIINERSIDMLITTSSPRFEEASIRAAIKLNIPILRIEQLFSPNQPIINNKISHAVLNGFVKRRLINWGVSEKNIFITGQPAFDNVKKIDSAVLNNYKIKNRIGFNSKIVTWFSPGNKNQLNFINVFEKIAKNNSEICFVIKLHPNEDGEQFLNSNLSKLPNVIIKKGDLDILLNLSDIILTEFSSLGVSALMLNKKLITVNFSESESQVFYFETKQADHVEELSELEFVIKRNLKSSKTVKEEFYTETNAAENIYKLIKKILDESNYTND